MISRNSLTTGDGLPGMTTKKVNKSFKTEIVNSVLKTHNSNSPMTKANQMLNNRATINKTTMTLTIRTNKISASKVLNGTKWRKEPKNKTEKK